MEHLPPVGWADVATKRDLDQLAVATKRDLGQLAEGSKLEHKALEQRMETIEQRLAAQFRGELVAQTRTFVLSMIGLFLTSMGISVAVS